MCVWMAARVCQEGEALESGTKQFEDLEFQQLERESSLEEERETISQQLLQERAEYHSSMADRKVRPLSRYDDDVICAQALPGLTPLSPCRYFPTNLFLSALSRVSP